MLFNLLGNDAVIFGQSSNAVVRFSHPPDLSADSIHLQVVSGAASGRVNVSNGNLDGSMVLSSNDSVAGRTEEKK